MVKFGTWAALALALSCSQDKLPCTDSGEAWLYVPQSRVGAVAEVRTEGVCEAVKPVGDCAPSDCVTSPDGEQLRVVPVRGRSPGRCTVTVAFTDDCPDQPLAYQFGGPLNNCCADVCFRRTMGSYAIDACADTQ
jgi:hypothetical protein